MFNKIKDKADHAVSLVIIMDEMEQVKFVEGVLRSVGEDRVRYAMLTDVIGPYAIEATMPQNRYQAFMQTMTAFGYGLKSLGKENVVRKLIKK